MGGSLGCHRDLTGSTKEYLKTAEGYHTLYEVWLACLGNKTDLDASYTFTSVKDKILQHWISELMEKAKVVQKEHLSNWNTQDPELNSPHCKGPNCEIGLFSSRTNFIQAWFRSQTGVHYNVLLKTQGIAPHRDTPGEICHTYLLGNDNHLQASSIDGLSIPSPQYVIQYKNSLIGKHFKMLQQLATGELGAHLWFPEIKNMDVYLADLEVLINNLLNIWGLIDPNRILVKGKIHIMAHLVEDF
ncbi:hypothetical protein B0H10DRAFT_1947802 [Mycena sp. CBHHK59/15]|nr:hypothetical protein B0H10DRAFT_1947802 [Mycena sp. CBHHK59/15]